MKQTLPEPEIVTRRGKAVSVIIPVAQQGPFAGQARVMRKNGQPAPWPRFQKAQRQLINQRRLARSTRTGDADCEGRAASGGGWGAKTILRAGDQAKPQTFPDVAVGVADKVTIRIYDISGHQVSEATLDAPPALIDDGSGPQYAYEYSWEGHIPSGVKKRGT